MKFSLAWLSEFVTFPEDLSPQQLAEKVTLHIAEVEEVCEERAAFEQMVVGIIERIATHPNADKLKICHVDIGEQALVPIICGGKNIYEGMRVAVALPGARVKWHGEGDPVVLEEATIRGEKSRGMICASAEIGLADSTDKQPEGPEGVMDLRDVEAEPGTPLAEALEKRDVVLDIENKSLTHRPDLWGHRGFARDVAAVLRVPFRDIEDVPLDSPPSPYLPVRVTIKDSERCLRYVGVSMKNVSVGPSPEWLKRRLEAVGQRSINNIVDISNYIMYLFGQPVHIFDAQKIAGEQEKEIIVRAARDGESIETLDGENRTLREGMLVIADQKKPIAIAGVMGGANSEVDADTSDIVIEVAHFDAASIRRTAALLGLRTEASARFEKSLDPSQCDMVARHVVQLVQKVSPGAVVASDLADEGAWRIDPLRISFPVGFIDAKIGRGVVVPSDAQDILERLGCRVEIQGDTITAVPPSWRSGGDLSIPEDIVEEIARVVGYNHIPVELPRIQMAPAISDPFYALARDMRQFLSSLGMVEVMNYAFLPEEEAGRWGYKSGDMIRMVNPPAEDAPFLSPSLMPGIWRNVRENVRWEDSFSVFEIARVFRNQNGEYRAHPKKEGFLPNQPRMLAGAVVGERSFVRLKGIVERIVKWGKWDILLREQEGAPVWLSPGASLALVDSKGNTVGWIGHCIFSAEEKLAHPASLFEIDFQALAQAPHIVVKYKGLPTFPAVKRDIAVVVDERVRYRDLAAVFEEEPFVESVEIFDVYRGDQVGKGKKSMAFHVVLRASDRTLTNKEADAVCARIMDSLRRKLNAAPR